MLKPGKSYEEVYHSFRWHIPDFYNIGVDICDKNAHQRRRTALIYEKDTGEVETFTFQDLKRFSNQLANAFDALGLLPGDRVGILLPQCPETAIGHIATYKVGGVAIPLFTLFGSDALTYRLADSQAKMVITDSANLDKVLSIRKELPHLQSIIVVHGGKREGIVDFWDCIGRGAGDYTPFATRADDPALIIYTSGTTGPPKGALHAHRTLLGHLPGVEFPHNFFPRPGDLFWTPADWAWIGGLIDVLFPSWHHGIPVLAYRARKFDPEYAFYLMAKHNVRNAFLPPTALKMMRQVKDPGMRYAFRLRSVGSGGETLGAELLEWGRETLGVTVNEFYGQTEANLVVGNCAQIMTVRPGSMGRAVPGHTVEIVDDEGRKLPAETVGNIAIRRPDPVMFLEYWNNPEATRNKFVGSWCLTGDMGRRDLDGYLWFVGRQDDLITSAGYRIGPGEIEDCLIKHPAVAMAAVIGVPDELRTEIVKAFVVLKPGAAGSADLKSDIQNHVRNRLAAHEYPRKIAFVDELPMTATGKIIRRELRRREISNHIMTEGGNMLPDIKRILYATDLSENARHAFGYAASLANRYGAKIIVLHVIEDFSPSATLQLAAMFGEDKWKDIRKRQEKEVMETIKKRLETFYRETWPDTVDHDFAAGDVVVKTGEPVNQILKQAEQTGCDLIVMGTHGQGMFAEALMGSTARRVVHRSRTPVLVVRLPEEKG